MAARHTQGARQMPHQRSSVQRQEPQLPSRRGDRPPNSPGQEAGLATTGRRLMGWLAAVAAVALLQTGMDRGAWAAAWKACSFNDRPIPCRDLHFADGSVRIVWQDGLAMTYRLIKAGFPISILRDGLGGRWEREILPQGNAVFINPANGNRIVVPLR